MSYLLGSAPGQVPVNGLLGTAAFVNIEDLQRFPTVVTTGSVSLLPFNTYVLTATGTYTLPPSPQFGDWVRIVNRSGVETAAVARNGNPIQSLAEDMTIDEINGRFLLVYVDATRGWIVVQS